MAGPPGIRARSQGFADIFERSTGGALTPLNVVIERVISPVRAVIEGRETLMFGTNSYLGLNFDPTCIEAASTALASFGTGSTASRVASGNQALHVELEKAIAELYGRRDAVVFSTGFMANLGAIGGLVREGDAVVLDAHCHASIFDACRLSGAKILTFKHNDASDLARVIAQSEIAPSRLLVIVEGLYSVLGDIADLKAISTVTAQSGTVLLVDEAHSLGLFGAKGRGVAEAQGVEDKVDVIVGTFSKSVGVVGGYCVTNDPAFRALRFAARSYLYTASLPPPVVAAARQALSIIAGDSERRAGVFSHAEVLHRGLTSLGLPPLAPPGPVGAVRMPGIKAGLDTWTALLRAGLYVNMLIPPATPNGEVVLRYSVSAAHSASDIEAALDIIATAGRQTGVLRPAA
ncbi:aminotransferase class I/II-fold pyridoxal phosphate-dependent enzyme [Labrys sp. ZIDIC5]|uniref:aminotransferase class I/II-fold pyridoxal phosphate-dependent enzyme n=1 Tax=Labrys sedimenti TaxID=3106036 RepID=UPI002ACA8ABC|nr:aminotransferase class I/II-fold pyridoxal phosphate-dependent enzyme [Labrys sp. ZIDIC5]MDZ5450891.1 aminotransferase class I/II-fold pyridoxal phosphate-dependent enzyme [Labrys sp. ZIDIC5]